MAFQGYDPFDEIGAENSTSFQAHTLLRAAYELDGGYFEIRLSPVVAGSDTLFTRVNVFRSVVGVRTALLGSYAIEDSVHENIGTVTLDGDDYPNTEQYRWEGVSNPLEDVADLDTFAVEFEGLTSETTTESVPFEGVVWWPHLDMGNFGVQKSLIGFDVVSDAPEGLTVSVGYDQRNVAARTTPYEVDADTLPGQLIPLPVGGPSLDLKLTFNASQQWELQAANLYIQDNRPTS